MKNISFFLTKQQFLDGTKDVTRRIGWATAAAGDVLMAVEKGQGLKRGEKVKELGPIQVVNARRERLDAITPEDVVREGFPKMTPSEFVEMFCDHNKCEPHWLITRIEFKRV